jgi:polyferredoxin
VTHGRLAKLRRASQIFFLALFFFLLLRTEFRGSVRSAGSDVRLPYPVQLFFQIDPLVALSNALASHALYRGLLWALVIIVPTLFLGRFFCGWICPLGTINHFFGSLQSERKRGKQLIESNRYKRWQTTKYYILIAVLVAAVSGTALVGWFDPFSLLVRSLGLSIMPGVNYALNATFKALEHSGIGPVQTVGNALHWVFSVTVLNFRQPHFRQGFFLGLIFIFILVLNLRVTRFWCRAICPLGGLLGIVSRWSVFGLQKNEAKCNDCNRCLMRCQGGDDPIGKAKWHRAECLMCFNCVASCPEDSLRFKFFNKGAMVEGPNLQRRKALTGAFAGIAAVPLLRSTTGFAAGKDERLLRPPGSLDESDFLQRCLRCGECMKVCPNNALHPAITEAGAEGLWTPVVVPHIGYCEPSCVLCSQVCPTGAIWEITPKEKGWVVGVASEQPDRKPIRIGTAFYDRGRCLPWAMGVECIVCEEWCPTSPKAIYLQTEEVIDAKGKAKLLKQPRIDPERCVGCGSCEHACVLPDRPAVYVTSVGESRSRTNQLLLNSGKGARKS